MTTSAAKPGEEGLATVNMQEGVKVVFSQSAAEPSSSEGAGVILQHGAPEGLQEGGTPDCSSSDQVKCSSATFCALVLSRTINDGRTAWR